jgi:hypothetical protein
MKKIEFEIQRGEVPIISYGKIIGNEINQRLEEGMSLDEYPRFPIRALVDQVDKFVSGEDEYEIVIKVSGEKFGRPQPGTWRNY